VCVLVHSVCWEVHTKSQGNAKKGRVQNNGDDLQDDDPPEPISSFCLSLQKVKQSLWYKVETQKNVWTTALDGDSEFRTGEEMLFIINR
jgi:hypothetical protein